MIALWNFTARRVRFFVTSSCLIKKHTCIRNNKRVPVLHQTAFKLGSYAACRRDWRLAKGDGSVKTSRASTMSSCCSVAAGGV